MTNVRSKDRALLHRLLSMGLVEGRKVKLIRTAPLGGALNISVIGFSLALRLSEAEAISVLIA